MGRTRIHPVYVRDEEKLRRMQMMGRRFDAFNCTECGKEVPSEMVGSGAQKTCSPACAKKRMYRMARLRKGLPAKNICPICGEPTEGMRATCLKKACREGWPLRMEADRKAKEETAITDAEKARCREVMRARFGSVNESTHC